MSLITYLQNNFEYTLITEATSPKSTAKLQGLRTQLLSLEATTLNTALTKHSLQLNSKQFTDQRSNVFSKKEMIRNLDEQESGKLNEQYQSLNFEYKREPINKEKVQLQLMGVKTQDDKTIQEKALEFLQGLGASVKNSYKLSVTKKAKNFQKNPSASVKSTTTSFAAQVSRISDNKSDNLSLPLNSADNQRPINQLSYRKQTNPSFLKLQSCLLIEEEAEGTSTKCKSSQVDELSESSALTGEKSISPRRFFKEHQSDLIYNSQSENQIETQSNSPQSNNSGSTIHQKSSTSPTKLLQEALRSINLNLEGLCQTSGSPFGDIDMPSQIPQQDSKFQNLVYHRGLLKQFSISPEKLGYKKEQPIESVLQHQPSYKRIRMNLMNLVQDLECENIQGYSKVERAKVNYEKIKSFKINLKSTK